MTFLAFTDASPDTDFYHNILRHCTNLKKFLYTNETRTRPESIRWMLNEQLKLEKFMIHNIAYHRVADEFERLARQFLRQNPQLRLLSFFAKQKFINVHLTNAAVESVRFEYYEDARIDLIRNDVELFTLDGNPGKLSVCVVAGGCSAVDLKEIVHVNGTARVSTFSSSLYNFRHFSYIQQLNHLNVLRVEFARSTSSGHTVVSFMKSVYKGPLNL